jgi:hypothetical protein
VTEFRLADRVAPNFHQGLIAYRDRTIAVVCARDAAVVALAEPRVIDLAHGVPAAGPLTFVSDSELVAVLAVLLPACRVLTPSELDRPLDPAAWPHLSSEDVEYWQPANVGAALFNYWD